MTGEDGQEFVFGELLRAERILRGLTQEQLADASGLSARSIRSLESGAASPRRRSVTLLCAGLEMPADRRHILLEAAGYARLNPEPASPRLAYPLAARRNPADLPAARLAPGTAPAQLPRDVPDFVGRASHMSALTGHLTRDTSGPQSVWGPRIAAVNGMGGVGKTALATHLAHRVRDRFPDGQLFVDLGGSTEIGPATSVTLGRMLRDLGVSPQRIPPGVDERAALLRSHTADRRILFVLDNARDTAQIRSLLPASAWCSVLVTSRTFLGATEGALHITLEPLTAAEARALLTAIAADALAPEDDEPVGRILAYCAGLPLAVRVIAAQLTAPSSQGAAAVADLLSQSDRPLDSFVAEDLSVRGTLATCLRSLDPADAPGPLALRTLFLFGRWPGGAMGARCVAAALGIAEPDAADALALLVDTSLLQLDAPDRYKPHDLIKLYAGERAAAELETAQLETADPVCAGLRWYLQAADHAIALFASYFSRPARTGTEPATTMPDFADAPSALAWYESEFDTLLALGHHAATAEWDAQACQLAILLLPFCEQRMLWPEWIATQEMGAACARRSGDRLAEGRCLSGLASAHRRAGAWDLSLKYCDEALPIFVELGDRKRVGIILNNRARTLHSMGDLPGAIIAHRDSVEFQRGLRDSFGLSSALNHLAMALAQNGEPAEALGFHRESIAIARVNGLEHAEGSGLQSLSVTYLALGRADEAQGSLVQSLALARRLGDRIHESESLQLLGQAKYDQGLIAEAYELWRQSLELMDTLSHPGADALRRRLT